MQVHYTGKNIQVTQNLKEFANEKFKLLESHYSRITNVYIVFTVEKTSQMAEGTLHATGIKIHAKASSVDMYQSIEKLVEKLLAQLTKHKEKITEHQR